MVYDGGECGQALGIAALAKSVSAGEAALALLLTSATPKAFGAFATERMIILHQPIAMRSPSTMNCTVMMVRSSSPLTIAVCN